MNDTNALKTLTSSTSPNKLDWGTLLRAERAKPYFLKILQWIEAERAAGKIIYPSNAEMFNAFKLTPADKLKVVIIGQDPYHGAGQAQGLCFSVKKGVPPPPSLENIFKEISSDLGLPRPTHGCLESWAEQGVLLLNSVLSVEASLAGSHAKLGWQQFTDFVISSISENYTGLVFMLWGAYAHKKAALIDANKHELLTSVHPSPLSAHRGFLGCKHFSRCNQILEATDKRPIDWSLPK